MQITIRKAEPYDAVNISRLLEQAHYDGEGMYPQPDPILMLGWVLTLLGDGYVVVAEKGGRIIGSVGLSNYRFPWSSKWYVMMEWFFVARKFRSGGVFDALLVATHSFADERNAPIYAGIQSGRDPTLKDRLMKIKGYHYLGGQFLRLEHGRKQVIEEHVHAGGVHRGRGKAGDSPSE